MEWWGGHSQHKLPMSEYKNHFVDKKVPPPKIYWVAIDNFTSSDCTKDLHVYEDNEDLIRNIIDDCAEVLFSTDRFNSTSNYNEENISDDLCTEIDDQFDNQLSITLENSNNNDYEK